MKGLDRIFDIFREALDNAHIPTVTVDGPYHSDTAELYELAFDVYHQVKEANQNLEKDEAVSVCDVAQETYDLACELKTAIDGLIASNKDTALDNILRTLAEKSLMVRGKMKRYQRKTEEKKEEPEEEDEAEEPKVEKKINILKK